MQLRRDVAWSIPTPPRPDHTAGLAPTSRASRRLPIKALVAAMDMSVLAGAMAIAFALRSMFSSDVAAEAGRHLVVGLISLPMALLSFVHSGLYRANKVIGRRDEAGRILHAVAAWTASLAMIGFGLRLYASRGWLVLTLLLAIPALVLEREVVRRWFRRLRTRGHLLRRVLIVGANADSLTVYEALADPTLGYWVLGFVDDDLPVGYPVVDEQLVLGSVDQTLDAAVGTGAQGVVVSSAVGMVAANRLARELPEHGVSVELVPPVRDIAMERLSMREFAGFPVMHVERVQRDGWRAGTKRFFDVVVALSMLLLAAPILVVIAIAVRLSSRGPILFRQHRVGRDGAHFEILKFRTMAVDADERLKELLKLNEASGPLFKIQHDPRITGAGRVLRRFSFDELPQLWNVLRGEMSIVGPRPALPHELTGWSPELYQRLRVRPGITGMWQVHGRSSASFDDYTRLDLYYVDNWSLLVDLTIIAKTLPAVLSARGAC